MHNITKHDSEKEGECNNGEQCWVNFLVLRNTISIDDFLEWPGYFICFYKGWSNEGLLIEVFQEMNLGTIDVSFLSDLIDFLF